MVIADTFQYICQRSGCGIAAIESISQIAKGSFPNSIPSGIVTVFNFHFLIAHRATVIMSSFDDFDQHALLDRIIQIHTVEDGKFLHPVLRDLQTAQCLGKRTAPGDSFHPHSFRLFIEL